MKATSDNHPRGVRVSQDVIQVNDLTFEGVANMGILRWTPGLSWAVARGEAEYPGLGFDRCLSLWLGIETSCWSHSRHNWIHVCSLCQPPLNNNDWCTNRWWNAWWRETMLVTVESAPHVPHTQAQLLMNGRSSSWGFPELPAWCWPQFYCSFSVHPQSTLTPAWSMCV